MFSTESQPDMDKEVEMHAQRQRAAIFALKELVRARGASRNLNELVQKNFDMTEEEAHGAIDDAYRSLALVDQDAGGILLGIVKDSIEDKNV